jgi:hypothetical protein
MPLLAKLMNIRNFSCEYKLHIAQLLIFHHWNICSELVEAFNFVRVRQTSEINQWAPHKRQQRRQAYIRNGKIRDLWKNAIFTNL